MYNTAKFLNSNQKIRVSGLKRISLLCIFILFFSIYHFNINYSYGADPKLISTLNNAFEKIEGYILKLSTPAAAVAVGSGLLMKKFSFGDEEKIRTAKKLVRGSLFSYGFVLLTDMVLQLIKTLLA